MGDIAIAVPARNEERYLARHLDALEAAAERTGASVSVLLLANNCSDRTGQIAREHSGALKVHVVEAQLGGEDATAGGARRIAAAMTASLFPEASVILTTDADSELTPSSLSAISAHLRAGADMVCGAISASLPASVAHAPSIIRHERVAEPYAALTREIRFAIDQLYRMQPPESIPHYVESGACIALTRELYQRIGGLPAVEVSEDRALVRAAENVGARIRYAQDAHAVVSARLDGRAVGGMADTMRQRLTDPDPFADSTMIRTSDLRRHWDDALSGLGFRSGPPMPIATPLLRTSDLERELPLLAGFVADVVRPFMAGRRDRRVA